jgi:DNA-binding LacI/PurR family transcriptional regulator
MTVTLKQIAAQANVSMTTVSRILNGKQTGLPIRDDTRQRVMSIARELGYKPNLMARALRGSHSSLIGTIIRDVTEPFLNQILNGANSVAVAQGYRLILGHLERKSAATIDYGYMFEEVHADGIILIGDTPDSEHAIEYLNEKHRFVVGITDRTHRSQFPGVYTDNEMGVSLALDHLRQLGHRRITCVTDPTINDGLARLETYKAYMHKQGLYDCIDAHFTTRSPEGGYQVGLKLFDSEHPPTALIAATDMIALGLLRACDQMNVRIPEDISIVGYDDIEMASFAIPPLTTISQSGEEMGRIAVGLLLDMIAQQTAASEVDDILLKPTLVVRQTTGRVRAD